VCVVWCVSFLLMQSLHCTINIAIAYPILTFDIHFIYIVSAINCFSCPIPAFHPILQHDHIKSRLKGFDNNRYANISQCTDSAVAR
jgi:hypothetical protein